MVILIFLSLSLSMFFILLGIKLSRKTASGLKMKIHVVGFNIGHSPEAVEQLKKVAEMGQGKFFMAESAEQLSKALAEAVKVTYSVYDDQNHLVYTKPLGTESNELMSGTYRIEVALDPPLVMSVTIQKGKTSEVNVIQQKKVFRIESSASVPPASIPISASASKQPGI